MWISYLGLALVLLRVDGLYTKNDDVIELTENNFNQQVLNYDGIVIVEFFAPWCGHCKNLVPEYKKAATALKGIAKVASVDATQHQSLGSQYGVRGYPSIKIFGLDKKKPTDYNGARTAQGIVDTVINSLKQIATQRLGGGGSSSSGGSSKSGSGGKGTVVELTDSNFDKIVYNSKTGVLVEFFAPWCGHCKNLEPHYKAAAAQLSGKMVLATLDATVHTSKSNEFGIKGFPTIKYFPAGSSSPSDAIEYDGGRTTADIVNWASSKASENLPPPELKQAISKEVVKEACDSKQICVITFLPPLLDCQSECRNNYLKTLKEQAEKFKKSPWGWLWVEAAEQPKFEEAFEVGGFGYPAMIAVNTRKLKYSTMTGSFGKDGISEFLRDLSYGRGKTSSILSSTFPEAETVEAWDGKDAELPIMDDIDLSDVELEDLDEEPKKTEL